MTDYIQVITTVDSEDAALRIVDSLVENRLAGCCQIIGPIKSTYWWKNKIERSEEWLIVIKSKSSHYKRIEGKIKEVHPYDIPEILAIPVVDGNRDYLNWLNGELKDK